MADLGERNWYIVTTYSQHERKVADNLKKRIETLNLRDYIDPDKVLVVEQEVTIMDRSTGLPTGKTKMKNLFPGNIFVEMIMTDKVWYDVRNTPGVTGIAGSAGGGQNQLQFLKKKSNQFSNVWVLLMHQCTNIITLVIQSESSVDHLKVQKVRFFLSIRIQERVELRQSSSVEQLLSMSNFLKLKEYNCSNL